MKISSCQEARISIGIPSENYFKKSIFLLDFWKTQLLLNLGFPMRSLKRDFYTGLIFFLGGGEIHLKSHHHLWFLKIMKSLNFILKKMRNEGKNLDTQCPILKFLSYFLFASESGLKGKKGSLLFHSPFTFMQTQCLNWYCCNWISSKYILNLIFPIDGEPFD